MRRMMTLALGATLLLSATAAAQPYGDPDALVAGWYARFLGRPADPSAGGWANALRQGRGPASVLASILGSGEYYARAGNTPQGFVQRLYLDLAGREPTPQEYGFWLRRMTHTDRDHVARQMLHSFPQAWRGAAAYAPPPPEYPPAAYGPYPYGGGYNYRRPYYPYRR